MKFSPVRIDEKPVMKMPNAAVITCVFAAAVGGDLELVLPQLVRHHLPVRRGLDGLPLGARADANRHRERALVGFPSIRHRPRLVVERQLQRGEIGPPQVLIEDRRQILLQLRVEEADDVLGHDVLVLEVLVGVAHQLPPPRVVIDDAAQRVQEERALEVHVLVRACGGCRAA